ncbi:MAG: hypothetical protein IKU30_06010 [Clostridia bacterium]|nr:hypothetical protein [Clostridia bacterium]MBR6447840.1 hypothetical protein [Methanomicrobium sp.]
MISYPITMDGVTYSTIHVVSLKRNFTVLDGENAGRVQSGGMLRDVIGTFYNYSMEIDPDAASRADYDAFFEAISAPVDSHVIEVPYAQTTLVFDAYVTQGGDDLTLMEDNANRWENLTFNFIAMEPQRYAE